MPYILRALLWVARRWGLEIAAGWAVLEGIEFVDAFVDELVRDLGEAAARKLLDLVQEQRERPVPVPREAIDGANRIKALAQQEAEAEETTGGFWENPYDEVDELLARECRAWEEYDRCR